MAKNGIKNPDRRPNKILLGRTLFLMVVCGILAFIVLGVKLYNVMVTNHEYYERMAVEQQTRETTVTAKRGTIYDTNGNILAISATAYNVFISPYEIQKYNEDVAVIAKKLSTVLGVDYNTIIERSKKTESWYEVVARKVDVDVADKIREFIDENELKGVHIEETSKRYYPYGDLASNVVGFVGGEGNGLEGVEAGYDEYLKGNDGKIIRLSTASGTDMLFTDYEYYYDAENGGDVELTIDVNIQNILEKNLQQAIADYGVQKGGCAIAMDCKTGAIKGMACNQGYDLNNPWELSESVQAQLDLIEDEDERNAARSEALNEMWRNRAISETYEPGSVFKIITLASALEDGVVDENSSFYCGGQMDVLGRDKPLNCWRHSGHGTLSLKQSVQQSCNCAFVQIGQRIGAERFYDYMAAFGLFDKTGVDLAGETGSIWWPESVFFDKSNLSQLAAASFGQTFTVTPLQVITAVSAVANGGNLVKPYVVSSIKSNTGEPVYEAETTAVRQVVSAETSRICCEMLEANVSESYGTGKNAAVAGYSIGGKTGTSEKIGGRDDEYIVSFCGFAPANNANLVILLLLDTPSSGTGVYISGGSMAAPVVGRMLDESLTYLGFEKQYTDEQKSFVDVMVTDYVGESVSSAKSAIEKTGLNVKVVGEGSKVTAQLPSANY
ncbi:MAG: PASTA domain-containing protein, partial [Oscillospiraceae bacterium]|nr:PASTA domain-containing protein [Oscillospiraceae bacterium]